MSAPPVVTRFAPSPSGEMHLGNARTALFNAADRVLFAAAAGAAGDNDFAAISAAARAATGLRGPALFKPLRAALTGRLAGPELAPLLRAMPPGAARQRLARFA